MDSFTENGLAKIAAAHGHTSAARTSAVTSPASQHQSGAAGLSFAGNGSQNLTCVRIHQSRCDPYHRLGVLRPYAPVTETPASSQVSNATAANAGALIVAAKLGDAAHDDGIHSQNPADLCRGGGVRSVAVGEVLLCQNLIQGAALNH